MNKGLKLILCPTCKRKRFCSYRYLLPAREWTEWTCSKKHKWTVQVGKLSQIIAIELENVLPKLKDLFNRDDTFYTHLRK